MKRAWIKRKTPLKRSRIAFKPRKPIRRVSKTRAAKNQIYSRLRREFLSRTENQICLVGITIFNRTIQTCQIHHMLGTAGDNFLDTTTWMAVSDEGHKWIEANKTDARERGWLGNKHTGQMESQISSY